MAVSEKQGCLAGLLRMLGLGKNPEPAMGRYDQDKDEELPYLVRDDFFSPAEASFYRVLKNVVGEDYVICPKVSLREIFFVSKPKENMAFYNKIDRKHVDYLICDAKTLKPAVAFELDDASHNRADRVERDEFVDKVFEIAGLRLVRIPARTAYSTQELKELVYRSGNRPAGSTNGEAAGGRAAATVGEGAGGAPLCPKCGVEMVLRTAARGEHTGEKFYGCTNYPKCREVRAIG